MKNFKPTDEQHKIIYAIKDNKTIIVYAKAGTGKTSTLNLAANTYANQKILYLAFNSGIKKEAQAIFPKNCAVKTTHSLAYGIIKKHTNIDLSVINNDYKVYEILKHYGLSDEQEVKSALEILKSFHNSNNSEVHIHSPESKLADTIFKDMENGNLKPTHSFYLKKFQLLLLDNTARIEYDITMLDEAQDTNEVTLSIFSLIKAKRKIYVGDPHQAIYSFRGSINAMDKIPNATHLYLTKTFRYTQKIANMANKLLLDWKNETHEIVSEVKDTNFEFNPNIHTKCYISRTNSILIDKISEFADANVSFRTVRSPYEIFALIEDVQNFLGGKPNYIKRYFYIKDFEDEFELTQYADAIDDTELISAIRIAKKHKDRVFKLKELALKYFDDDKTTFHIFLTTAHTSKGLEWDCIEVLNGFISNEDLLEKAKCESKKQFANNISKIPQNLTEEINLKYVTWTRAKQLITFEDNPNTSEPDDP